MTNHGINIDGRLAFAMLAARAAGKIILNYYQDPKLTVDVKRDRTLVTEADRRAELRIRELVAAEFPEDGFLGEEYGEVERQGEYQWIVDPIDGTQAFVCGVPLFGTLIGVTRDKKPTLGVAFFPALGEMYYARLGDGAWWLPANSAEALRARTSGVANLSEALLCATSVSAFTKTKNSAAFERLLSAAGTFRGWGDCYGHMLVATGRADIMADAVMHIWDCAALYPIVTEAGGRFFDFAGVSTIDSANALSTNAALSSEVLRLLIDPV